MAGSIFMHTYLAILLHIFKKYLLSSDLVTSTVISVFTCSLDI